MEFQFFRGPKLLANITLVTTNLDLKDDKLTNSIMHCLVTNNLAFEDEKLTNYLDFEDEKLTNSIMLYPCTKSYMGFHHTTNIV
jgi:hypothetical protein